MDTTGASAVWLLAIVKMMSSSADPGAVAKQNPPAPAVVEAKAPAAIKAGPVDLARPALAKKPLLAAVQAAPAPLSPKRPPG